MSVAREVVTTYARIGRLRAVRKISPSSLFTAVFASQLKAMSISRRSSLRMTTSRFSASWPDPPSENSGESIMDSRTRAIAASVLMKTMMKTAKPRTSAKPICGKLDSTTSPLRRAPSTTLSTPSLSPRALATVLVSPVTKAVLSPARRARATATPSCALKNFTSSPRSDRPNRPSVRTPSTSMTSRRTRRARAVRPWPPSEDRSPWGTLPDADNLTAQTQAEEFLAFGLRHLRRGEVAVADHERQGLARLGRHPHLMTGGAEPLGHLHRPAERQRCADPDRQRLGLAEHRHVVEPIVAEVRNERLRLTRRRYPLDENGVDRGVGLLAEARRLVPRLVQLTLDPLRLRRHDEGTELDGEARPGRRRRRLTRGDGGRACRGRDGLGRALRHAGAARFRAGLVGRALRGARRVRRAHRGRRRCRGLRGRRGLAGGRRHGRGRR